MDPNLIQSLMAPLQQMLQILQQAQGAGAAPGADPSAAPPGAAPAGGGPMDDSAPPGMEDDDDDDDRYGDDASLPGGDGGDPMAVGDDGMGGGASLHDRVSKLEGHTGLKKSASSPVGLLDRVAELEEVILGTEYEGPLGDRIGQLEKAAGVSTPKPATVAAESDEAPDEIPLDALIKSAIQAGIKEGMSAIAKTMPQRQGDDDDLPNPATMRKAAANGNHYGQRRAAPQAIAGDADLVKAAQNMGYTDEDLDAPASFGDLLMYQYHVGQGGQMLHSGDDDGDDD